MKKIKWVSVGGSSKGVCRQVKKDIVSVIKNIADQGFGLLSGGDFGVDIISIKEMLKYDPIARKVKIFLPVSFKEYTKYCKKKGREGRIIVFYLEKIKKENPQAIIENKKNNLVNDLARSKRDSIIIREADEAVSFCIGKDPIMINIIEKIRKKGIPLKTFSYDI